MNLRRWPIVLGLGTTALFLACGDDADEPAPSGVADGGGSDAQRLDAAATSDSSTSSDAANGHDASDASPTDAGSDGEAADASPDAGDAGDASDAGTPGEVRWARAFGGAKTDEIRGIAMAPNGDVVVVGSSLSPTLDFGCGSPLTQDAGASASEAFVVRLRSDDGSCVWARTIGGPDLETAYGVAVDPSGAVYVVGAFVSAEIKVGGSTVQGPATLTNAGGSFDAFFVKYDADGSRVFAKVLTAGPGYDYLAGVTYVPGAPGSERVVVVGGFKKTKDVAFAVEGLPVGSENVDQDIALVAAFETGGTPVWARAIRGASASPSAWAEHVTAGPLGDVLVGGGFIGALEPARHPATSTPLSSPTPGNVDLFVVQMSAAGDTTWARVFGGTKEDQLLGLGVDGAGRVFFSGTYQGSVAFGGGALPADGGREGFLAELQPDGGYVSSRPYATTGYDGIAGVAVRSDGSHVLVAGMEQSFDFGTGTPTPTFGSTDAVIAAYASSGAASWVRVIGSTPSELANHVAVSATEVAITGVLRGPLQVGTYPLPYDAGASEDVFVVKLGR